MSIIFAHFNPINIFSFVRGEDAALCGPKTLSSHMHFCVCFYLTRCRACDSDSRRDHAASNDNSNHDNDDSRSVLHTI